MNRTNNTEAVNNTPMSTAEVKRLLRDAAFVLRMTRQVKEDMLRDVERRGEPRTNDCPQFGSAV